LEAKRKFSGWTAAAIVIANMIGTGVFTSLGFQLLDIRSGFVIMALWVTGGIIAICGALSYAELAARLPRSGGEYNFLRETFHPAAGFVSGWISATVGFAAPTALAAITFGKYLSAVFPQLSALWLATGLVMIMTLIHSTSHRNSAGMQDIFTVAKIVLIIGFSVSALLLAPDLQNVDFMPKLADSKLITSGAFAVALIYVSYAYSGWNAATYLTGELEQPKRTLPWVLGGGTLLVMLAYVLLNVVFLLVAPMDSMAGQLEVGYIAAVFAFGEMGGAVMGVTLALLLVSTVSAMIIAAPRVYQVVGQDFALFKLLAATNKNGIPRNAIYLQGTLTLIFLWSASFESILIFSGATMALNTLIAVFGLFVLRHHQTKSGTDSPKFTVPLYPLPPIIFISLTGWTLIYLVIDHPIELAFSAGLIFSGLIGYWLVRRGED